MDGLWIALIVSGAACVVLAAVAGALLGPLRSLMRSVERMEDVAGELDRLRRSADVARRRADQLAERARGREA